MTHKFKIGDMVRCISIPAFDEGEITCDNLCYKTIDGDIERVYAVKVGYEIKDILEDGLEKIEEPHVKPAYKVGDRVIFYFTPDHVKIGVIEEINIHNQIYKIIFGESYYLIPEKDIICKSEIEKQKEPSPEEFKEGDEVWVKAKVSPWDGCIDYGEIFHKNNISVRVNSPGISGTMWVKNSEIVKSIPPKNEWISVKDKWPSHKQRVHFIYILDEEENAKITHTGYYDAQWKQFNLPYHNIARIKVTHWKPLDAPPE